MGIRKTDRDIALEARAHEINARLIGTGITVTGGGSRGPYSITVGRIHGGQVETLVSAILELTQRRPAEVTQWDKQE